MGLGYLAMHSNGLDRSSTQIEGPMKLVRTYLLSFLLVTLVACSSLGINPTTFNQKLDVAYISVTTVTNTATTLLQSGKLSVADANNIAQQATNLKSALDIARTIHDTSSPDLGDAKLQTALVTLQALQSYLGGVK